MTRKRLGKKRTELSVLAPLIKALTRTRADIEAALGYIETLNSTLTEMLAAKTVAIKPGGLDPSASPLVRAPQPLPGAGGDDRDFLAGRTVVSANEAMRALDCSRTKLYQILDRDELDSFLDGKSRKITVASIRNYISKKLQESQGQFRKLNNGMGRPAGGAFRDMPRFGEEEACGDG